MKPLLTILALFYSMTSSAHHINYKRMSHIKNNGNIIAYDGDNLFGYCKSKKKWVQSMFVEDNAKSFAYVDEDNGNQIVMEVGQAAYTLSANCQIAPVEDVF